MMCLCGCPRLTVFTKPCFRAKRPLPAILFLLASRSIRLLSYRGCLLGVVPCLKWSKRVVYALKRALAVGFNSLSKSSDALFVVAPFSPLIEGRFSASKLRLVCRRNHERAFFRHVNSASDNRPNLHCWEHQSMFLLISVHARKPSDGIAWQVSSDQTKYLIKYVKLKYAVYLLQPFKSWKHSRMKSSRSASINSTPCRNWGEILPKRPVLKVGQPLYLSRLKYKLQWGVLITISSIRSGSTVPGSLTIDFTGCSAFRLFAELLFTWFSILWYCCFAL